MTRVSFAIPPSVRGPHGIVSLVPLSWAAHAATHLLVHPLELDPALRLCLALRLHDVILPICALGAHRNADLERSLPASRRVCFRRSGARRGAALLVRGTAAVFVAVGRGGALLLRLVEHV